MRRYFGHAGMCVLCMVFCASSALADGTSWTAGQNVVTAGAPSRMLLVDKRLQQLQVVDTYECTTGQRDGGKELSGDMRTPEGVYFVTGKVQGKLSMSEYGGVGYALNYPNPIDRLHGRTGHGIWLHSRGRAITPKETRGCVVVNLDDMSRLKQDLKPGTPVILAGGITGPSDDTAVARLLERTDAWNKAWADRSETFFDFYDILSYEKANNIDFGVFRTDKQRTFLYDWLHVVHGRINILQGPDYWVTWFSQFYKSPGKTVEGVRRLYWIKRNGEFYIAGMEWKVEPAFDITLAQRRVPKAAKSVPSVQTQVAAVSMPKASPQGAAQDRPLPVAVRPVSPVPSVSVPKTSPQDAAKERLLPPVEAKPMLSVQTQVAAVSVPKTSPQDAAKERPASHGKTLIAAVTSLLKISSPDDSKSSTISGEVISRPKPSRPEDAAENPDVRLPSEETPRMAPVVTAATVPTFAPVRMGEPVVKEPVGQTDVPSLNMKASSEVRKVALTSPTMPVLAQGSVVQKNLAEKTLQDAFKPSKPIPLPVGQLSSKQLTTTVMNFVEYWRRCWEGGYLNAYVDCYAPGAVQQNCLGRRAIRNHKLVVWKNKAPASVRLTNIRVFPQLDGTVVVTMDQEYVDTRNYRDAGVKRIELTQFDGQWVIFRETWKKL